MIHVISPYLPKDNISDLSLNNATILATVNQWVFDSPQVAVFELMANDSLHRFRHSPQGGLFIPLSKSLDAEVLTAYF